MNELDVEPKQTTSWERQRSGNAPDLTGNLDARRRHDALAMTPRGGAWRSRVHAELTLNACGT